NRLSPDLLAAAALQQLPSGPLVVALGGGADSAVAAWAVSKRLGARGLFVRHGLIGSADLEQAALELGRTVGLDVTVVDAPVDPGPSLEDRARRARWQAIDRHVSDAETVVTGHTRDDQAETVLMNLLRGSGNAGIAGMLRSRPGVVRPLLEFSRTDLRTLAEELALPFVDDPANADPTYLRNRIRLNLLPLLEREYRSGVKGVLARAGSLAAADDLVVEELAADIPVLHDGGAVLIPSAALVTVRRSVASRTVRTALRRLLDPYAGSTSDVDAVLRVAEKQIDTVTLTNALLATREGPYVAIVSSRDEQPEAVEIGVPSSIDFAATTIRFGPVDRESVTRRSTMLVDPAILDGGAIVRCSNEGDRIEIAGGSKGVRTVLSEHGVPVRLRSTWPVVVTGGRIAVVVGIRVASWARPTASQAIAITKERGRS
ncbi:MAG: tRNA lysidine(34) synthetase TilS, partial [Actinomycetota bacterium]|nr:tRNA lysidine(34) synthetase TilS [Actinomycetota bacterium]